MKRFIVDHRGYLSTAQVQELSRLLKRGGVIVVPTDTSYGMAALISEPKAIQSVFRFKKRSLQKVSSIVVASQRQARDYVKLSSRAKIVWSTFLPGPLTLVLPAKKKFRLLTNDSGSIGIRRIPTHSVNQILRSVKIPFTITSANKHGLGDVYSYAEFVKQYKGSSMPAAFVDSGVLRKSKPSTVYDVQSSTIIRKGPITEAQLRRAFRSK